MIKKINIVSMILATSLLQTQSFVVADNLGHALGANGYLNNMPLYYKKCVRGKRRHCNPCKQRPVHCQKKRVARPLKRQPQIIAKIHHDHMKLAHAINQLPANNKLAHQK